jgi:hypothetical protein
VRVSVPDLALAVRPAYMQSEEVDSRDCSKRVAARHPGNALDSVVSCFSSILQNIKRSK